jgi:LysM repeat protein
MNTSNPFQIPTCLQRADLQQRRRERFKQSVVAIVAAVAALLVVLLIQGCMSEHAKTSSTTSNSAIKPSGARPEAMIVAAPKPAPILPAKPVVAATPVQLEKMALPAAARTETVYVVKSGDTLSRIAKLNQTTVKALKSFNGLDSDTITVGAKLKLPSA